MDLQIVRFCDETISEEEKKLFFKGTGFVCNQDAIVVEKAGNVSTDTLHNAFSWGKWKQNTIIDNIGLRIKFSGKAKIKLFKASYINTQTFKLTELSQFILEAKGMRSFDIPVNEVGDADLIYCSIIGISDFVTIKEIVYTTTINGLSKNAVDIAVGICTYRREVFVQKNVETINTALKKYSDLKEHLNVFISDNASTLPAEELQNDNIEIYQNKNLGGSSGFARCMVEAFFNKSRKKDYSHIILMDDDIVFCPEMLYTIYSFLSLLREEKSNAMIAFSMFPIEEPFVQYTKGKIREKNVSRCLNSALDMRYIKNVISNEKELQIPNFSGWWCHCIPRSYINEKNLPFPFFIRCDDTEYGCRYKNEIITLNCFSIKHPSFVNKHPISMGYYDTRNNLIFMTSNINKITKGLLLRELFFAYKHSLYFEYDRALLTMQGIEDFLNGAEAYGDIDMLALNDALRRKNYKLISLDEDKSFELDFMTAQQEGKQTYEQLRRARFLPAWKTKYISCDKSQVSLLFVKKLFCYDVEGRNGFWLEKDRKKAKECKKKYNYLKRKIERDYALIISSWREKFRDYTTLEWWIKTLNLNPEDYSPLMTEVPNELYPYTEIVEEKDGFCVKLLKKVFPWYTKAGDRLRKFVEKIRKIPHFTIRSDIGMHIRIAFRRILKGLGLSFLSKEMREIQALKNRHAGERCFIVCTGPSLTMEDLAKLKNDYTIGVNSITKAYEFTDWRPTYYALVDAYAYGEILKKNEVYGGRFSQRDAFFHYRVTPMTKQENMHKVLIHYGNHRKKSIANGRMKITYDPSVCIYDCFTVTNMAINLAIYMGFKKIYIIGADATYKLEKTHFIEGEWELIHKKAQKGLDIAVKRSMIGYLRMKEFARKRKVEVYNATRGGMLEIFPRANLDELFEEGERGQKDE